MMAPFDEYPVDYLVSRVDIATHTVTFWLTWTAKAFHTPDHVSVRFEDIENAIGLPAELAIMQLEYNEVSSEFTAKLQDKDDNITFKQIHIDSLNDLLP